jgi:hypothetical protein
VGLLQRRCACGQHTGGGECEECRKKGRKESSGGGLQRKLALGPPGDSFEREADRVAETVTSGGSGAPFGITAARPSLRRMAATEEPGEAPAAVGEALRSSGQPLSAGIRAFMEPRIGHDFSRVRVHTGDVASHSAAAVDALAYTVGSDVVFRDGQYAPETPEGRKLLAHELTHVVQQANGPRSPASVVGQAGASIMRQSIKEPPNKPKADSKALKTSPYVLPQVGGRKSEAVRDVTFVKVESSEEILRRVKALNQTAEEALEEERRMVRKIALKNLSGPQATIRDGSPEGALKEKEEKDNKVKEILKKQFGEGWGTFFWWTRGGPVGEGSPLWDILPALRRFNKGHPPQAFPSQRFIYKDTRGVETPTGSTKLPPSAL